MTDLDSRIPEFSIALRGYDRVQVDEYIDRLQGLVEEAEDRARVAETPRATREHTEVGPRIAKIFELAQAEAEDLRDSARREAKAMVQAAREEARAVIEQNQDEWERMLDEYEAERDRIRDQVAELNARRASVVGELRRLRETLGLASGIVESTSQEVRLIEPAGADGASADGAARDGASAGGATRDGATLDGAAPDHAARPAALPAAEEDPEATAVLPIVVESGADPDATAELGEHR